MMALAQAFTVEQSYLMTKVVIAEARTFKYDPPIQLEAGVKYSFNVSNGTLFRHEGPIMRRIADARVDD